MELFSLIEKGKLTNSLYYVGDITQKGINDTVVCSVLNSMWVVSLPRFIELNNIKSEHISFSKETGIEINGDLSHWTKVFVSSYSHSLRFSYQVPLNETTQITTSWGARLIVNDPRIREHGTGDYIVCHSKNGKPDMKHAYPVNGRVYNHEYTVVGDTSRANSIRKPQEITL